MATIARPATLDDLMRVEGPAELVDGEIVHVSPNGLLPGRIARRIGRILDDYVDVHSGEVTDGTVGYALGRLPSGRQSISPDMGYFTGPPQMNLMRFVTVCPVFAVEVRSENDYGPAPDRDYAAKRADYFAAGTLVVWDVDPLAETITTYRVDGTSATYRVGDTAEAEPACPGWRVAVAELFPAE